MMINGAGRMRAPDWTHEETLLLAKLRRNAVFSRTIEGVWTRIGNTILNNFGHTRSDDQCKRRWETLQKVYKAIQRYCEEHGREHWQLDRGDWESMKLATAYREDWYAVVKEVCEEEQNRKQRKRRRQYPEPTQPRQLEYGDQAAIVPPPNAHDNPQSSGTTVDGQSSTSLMLSPQIENLPPSQTKIERLKNKIQTLRLQLQLAEQELQQITQGDQEVLGNSSSPGTSQSSQVVEQEDPQILGTSAPQQLNFKHNIKTPNPAGGDGTSSFFMGPLEDAFAPLPKLTKADTWVHELWRNLTQFVVPHSNSGFSDITDLSRVPGALSFEKCHSVVGPHMPPSLWPYTDQQGRGITVTIDTRITIKAAQNPVPNTNQVMKTVHPHQERPPSIDLRLSTGTTKLMQEADEHQKLNAELQRLQQQLQNVIQQISQVKPIGSPGSELLVPCDVSNSAIMPSQSCLGERDTAVVTEERIEPNTGIDLNCLPSLPSSELPGGNEPGYYMVVADDIEPATDHGLTECLAQMSLSSSTTTLKSDLITSKKNKDSPKTTTTIPTASSEDSLMIEDDYPQGNLCLTMDRSWLASAPPSSVCDELLGRSVTNMGIYKSSINLQPYKSHIKELMPSRRWRMLELLMRAFLHFKRSTLPLSILRQNHMIADGNLGHDLQTQRTMHSDGLWECTDCNY